MHEASLHDRNSFITLTYDDQHLPRDGSLDVTEWQRFAKRARKSLGPFRYYHCGEYGDLHLRPHFHACVFGADFSADRRHWKTVRGNPLYVSPTLDRLWGRGYAVIGEVTFESAAYVARYITKKITGDQAEEHYAGRKPEYTTMSRRPGIGKGWFDRWRDEVYPADEVIARGHPSRPPKFYDSQYELVDAAGYDLVKRKRIDKVRDHAVDLTWDRLKVRERVATKYGSLYNRDPGSS